MLNVLKSYKPQTPGFRGRIITVRDNLSKEDSIKKLTFGKNKSAGRNNRGKITVYHQGGGHKQNYRVIDYKRQLFDVIGKVVRLEYDPNRTVRIALIAYENGILSYILAPNNLKINDTVIAGENIEIKNGNALPIAKIPVGTLIHNIELYPGKGGQFARSAGAYAQIIQKIDSNYVLIKLKSNEQRYISSRCMATIGVLSNVEHKNTKLGKAGASRWLNIRPNVRGVAMNPVDHPHGGRTKGARPCVSRWGQLTKGWKTRNARKTSTSFIISK